MTTYARGRSIAGESYKDIDGAITYDKMREESIVYDIDVQGLLESGETVSTATWSPSGVTIVSSSLTGTVVTVKVLGVGYATLTLTTSLQTLKLRFRWRSLDNPTRDYRS